MKSICSQRRHKKAEAKKVSKGFAVGSIIKGITSGTYSYTNTKFLGEIIEIDPHRKELIRVKTIMHLARSSQEGPYWVNKLDFSIASEKDIEEYRQKAVGFFAPTTEAARKKLQKLYPNGIKRYSYYRSTVA